MDEKTLARIFEAFYSTKPGGTGLGLPTTGKIIEAHGGTITCQSEVGRGTRFTIELPMLRAWATSRGARSDARSEALRRRSACSH